jgi:hypothetical protein
MWCALPRYFMPSGHVPCRVVADHDQMHRREISGQGAKKKFVIVILLLFLF